MGVLACNSATSDSPKVWPCYYFTTSFITLPLLHGRKRLPKKFSEALILLYFPVVQNQFGVLSTILVLIKQKP